MNKNKKQKSCSSQPLLASVTLTLNKPLKTPSAVSHTLSRHHSHSSALTLSHITHSHSFALTLSHITHSHSSALTPSHITHSHSSALTLSHVTTRTLLASNTHFLASSLAPDSTPNTLLKFVIFSFFFFSLSLPARWPRTPRRAPRKSRQTWALTCPAQKI